MTAKQEVKTMKIKLHGNNFTMRLYARRMNAQLNTTSTTVTDAYIIVPSNTTVNAIYNAAHGLGFLRIEF